MTAFLWFAKQLQVSIHFASDFFSMQPELHPMRRTKTLINTEWHSQKARSTHSDRVSPFGLNATTEAKQEHPNHLNPSDLDVIDDLNDVDIDNFLEQQARASPTQFMYDDVAHNDADEITALLTVSDSDGAEHSPTVAFSNEFGEDAEYIEQYGTASMLPPIDNSSKQTSPQRLQKMPSNVELKLSKVSTRHARSLSTINLLAQVSIGIPMSSSGRDHALNRWMRSQAVVAAAQYSRTKQHATSPAVIPPLQRISPTTFRKSLNKAPPSRVFSPDSKPSGSVETAVTISSVHYSKLPNAPSPYMSPSVASRPLKIGRKKVELLQVEDETETHGWDRSTPSPPPLPAPLRLGGIINGGKNIFVPEKSENDTAADHFGRSNMFNK